MRISLSTPLQKILELGKQCRQCGHCCSYTSGTLLPEDVNSIAEHLDMGEEKFKERFTEEQEKFNTTRLRLKQNKGKKPYGSCVFLKDNKCSINEVKPLHCRIGSCSEHGRDLSIWFMVKYFVNKEDPVSMKLYEIYLKNNPTIKGASLKEIRGE